MQSLQAASWLAPECIATGHRQLHMRLNATNSFRVGQTPIRARRVVSCRFRATGRQLCLPVNASCSLSQSQPSALTSACNAPSSNSSRPRGLVIAAAAGAGEGPRAALSLESLNKLKVPELKDWCRELGLQVTGTKAVLAQRIWDAQQQQQQQQDMAPAPAAGPPPAAAAADIERDELRAELVVEISQYSDDTLQACLTDRGLSQEGSRQQLVNILADAITQETLDMDQEDSAALQQQQQQQQDEDAGSAAAAAPAAPPPEREWLIADKQQVLLDELLAMGVMRQELVDILADMGQEAAEDETLEELAERASWLLAEEEVLLMEQQAAAGAEGGGAQGDEAAPAQQALAEHPSSILDGLTATDINKLKVDDLRKYLNLLGLSDEGSRYVLRDRLVTMLVVRKAATAGDMDHLLRQLASMTLSELRGELERRGLDLSGTKSSLELRLAQAMVVEIAGPQAAGMLGLTQDTDQAGEYEPDAPLTEDYDEFLTAVVDPAFRLALICGTGAGTSSSSSSRTHRVTQALATAVTIIDTLHTAPLDPKQAAAMEAAAAAAPAGTDASGSSSSKGKRGRSKKTDSVQPEAEEPSQADPSKVPACGITVDVYWGDESGTFYQLPRTALAAAAPADVAAALPALATAKFDSAAALAHHLQSSGAGAALSLPGGALAWGGALAEACAAAGVPLAVQSNSSSKQQPVLGRAAVLQELKQRGYMTLPVFEVQRETLLAAQADIQAWMEALMSGGEEPGEPDPDDALAAAEAAEAEEAEGAEGADSSSSSSKQERKPPVSPLLKAWSAARYDTAAAAEGVEEDADAAAAAVAQPPLAEAFAAWCESAGLDPNGQLLSVCDAAGGELLAAVRGGVRLLQDLVYRAEQDSCPPVLLVEPLHRQLCRWEVVVTVSPEDGPVALLPVEVESSSIRQDLLDADLALQEWRMMQGGVDPEDIAVQLELLSQDEPDCVDALKLPDSADPLPYHTLKLHSPPRASTKLIHTMRHAAARAVADLGLSGAGLVRVRGWYATQPDWQDAYRTKPEDIKKMPDADPCQLQRMRDDELSKRASEPLPLAEYYDEVLLLPDLDKFEPAARCRAERNGEGDVLLADVSVDVPLHTTSLAGIQAAEVGLGPGGLARHLINMALFAAGQDPLLPPPAPPAIDSSAQWAQFTGANDTLQEIAKQLADTNEKIREALETDHTRVADEEHAAAVQQLDSEAAITSLIDGLSFMGGTMEAIQAPVQEPQEWEPEFDTRTLQEIHAEHDAHRTDEDLAARQMRDEELPVYGDQPIKYDRYDPMEDWEPPFAAAAAAGQPIPSIEQLRQQVAERMAARAEELAEGKQDQLPGATEDEVMYGRLLEGSLYEGGVKETLKRRAEMAQETAGGGGAATMAASALSANVEAAEAAGEAAALSDAAAGGSLAALLGSGGSGDSLRATAERWPWPTAEEVLDEAAERRAAQRVWVLMGGDGPGRQQALRSGANVWAKLQRCCDLQVDAFLLPPAGGGLDESKRRAALLARRTEWMALGIPEDEYPQSMRDDQLLSMPPADLTALQRSVIVCGPSQLWRHTVEEATESAERLGQRAAADYFGARVQEQQQIQAARDTQMELDAHFVLGVGSSWGGNPELLSPAPRFLDIEEFVSEAAACGATVILATHDTLTATGELQQLLEDAGVAYTGVTADYALNSCNRIALNKHVTEIADSITTAAGSSGDESAGDDSASGDDAVGLIPMPIKVIKTDKLIGCLRTPQDFELLFDELMFEWEASDSLVLRPPSDTAGLGVARIHTPADLAVYAAAIATVLPRLPPGSLTQQQAALTLPLEAPALLVAEPWVETDPVAVVAGAGGRLEVTWAGSSSRWLEVSIGLLGELGSMSALPLTLISRDADGSRHHITPPPAHILPAESIEAAQGCAVAIAMSLGLRSIASVDGFVNADTGELIVRDVKPTPALTDGSPLLQQAMQLDPPLLPHQLFRQLARDAWLTNKAAQAAAAAGSSSISSAYYSTPADGAGLGAADFELTGVGGDIFAGPGAGEGSYAAAEEGGVGGVEDEDMQAAGFTA